jgi:nucleoside transporter
MSAPAISSPCPQAPQLGALLAARLALMMFLAYGILGPWVPVFSQHLRELGFSPEAVGWASAANAIGALLAPVVWGQVADRWVPAERCIALCALVCAGVLAGIAELTDPVAVFAACLGFWFFMIPVLSLGSALIFRQLDHPERDFGKIRLWGTVGWVAAGLLLSLWLALLRPAFEGWLTPERPLADSLRLGAGFALLLSLYAWTLPHTPPNGGPPAAISGVARLFDAPLQALRLARQRMFAVYAVCLFGAYLTMPFTTQLNPLLLRQLGIPDWLLPSTLTISQSTEVLSLALLPLFLRRLGPKMTMLLGLASWTTGLAVLMVGSPLALVLSSLICHGIFICGFLVAGQVFVNRQASNDIRASAQGVIHLISGLGLLFGNLAVGWIRDLSADDFHLAYAPAVLIAAVMALTFTLGFLPATRPAEAADSLALRQ